MLDQCRAIETAADVAEIILSLRTYTPSATPAIAKASLDVDINVAWKAAGRRCHVCSGELTQEEAIAECFGGGDNVMLAHRGCHLMRIESSPEAVLFAMKIGFWTMMRIQMEEGASWRRDMMKAWVSEFGSRIASTVAAPHVPDWSDLATIDTPEDLVRFARHLYLFERERPKWGHQGREVPPWDETVSWKDYKRHKFMPAYRTLTRLKDRKTLRPASEVLARTGGLCALCGGEISTRKDGGSLRLAKDHIHPFSKGGSDGITNLQPLHYACNGAITSVGPGEIPLSLQIGRWLIAVVKAEAAASRLFQPNCILPTGGGVVESSHSRSRSKSANLWIGKLLKAYATYSYSQKKAQRGRRKTRSEAAPMSSTSQTSASTSNKESNLMPVTTPNPRKATKKVTIVWPPAKALDLATKTFFKRFPGGFNDAEFLKYETNWKRKVHECVREELSLPEWRRLLDEGNCDEVRKRLIKMNKYEDVPLPSRYERMAFNGAIKKDSLARTEYFEALYGFLATELLEEPAFDRLVEALDNLPLTGECRPLKWPNMTCIPHFYYPDRCPPLKPNAAKETAMLFGYDLQYKSRPNWVTYQRWIKFHEMLLHHLKPHGATDMFDVASFVWVMVRWNVELVMP